MQIKLASCISTNLVYIIFTNVFAIQGRGEMIYEVKGGRKFNQKKRRKMNKLSCQINKMCIFIPGEVNMNTRNVFTAETKKRIHCVKWREKIFFYSKCNNNIFDVTISKNKCDFMKCCLEFLAICIRYLLIKQFNFFIVLFPSNLSFLKNVFPNFFFLSRRTFFPFF